MLEYRIDVIDWLRQAGYNTGRIKKEKILPESTVQRLRNKEMISMSSLNTICRLLDMQPGNIIKYVEDKPE